MTYISKVLAIGALVGAYFLLAWAFGPVGSYARAVGFTVAYGFVAVLITLTIGFRTREPLVGAGPGVAMIYLLAVVAAVVIVVIYAGTGNYAYIPIIAAGFIGFISVLVSLMILA